MLENKPIAIVIQIDSLGQAQDLSTLITMGTMKAVEVVTVQRQHLHLPILELL